VDQKQDEMMRRLLSNPPAPSATQNYGMDSMLASSKTPGSSTLSTGQGMANALVKPQLKLKDLRKYRGERKDGACEQWCLDAYAHLQSFVAMTGVSPTEQQRVEYLA